ncbi:MAG: FAD-dependent oxidoreductase, partial [Patescibacteria group bacterium]|nr:FAD-dependent oxidoreductase [Patescibacteria group bacterium]
MGKRDESGHAGWSRRRFMTAATVGLVGAAPLQAASAASDVNVVADPRGEAPIVAKVDVLVCGGGPAGVGAALYAARTGAKTMLIESMPFLGGVWTAVGVSHLMA